jgi:hypothetical protein
MIEMLQILLSTSDEWNSMIKKKLISMIAGTICCKVVVSVIIHDQK